MILSWLIKKNDKFWFFSTILQLCALITAIKLWENIAKFKRLSMLCRDIAGNLQKQGMHLQHAWLNLCHSPVTCFFAFYVSLSRDRSLLKIVVSIPLLLAFLSLLSSRGDAEIINFIHFLLHEHEVREMMGSFQGFWGFLDNFLENFNKNLKIFYEN